MHVRSLRRLGAPLALALTLATIGPSPASATPGTTVRVNVDGSGQIAPGYHFNPIISSDGSTVVFGSDSPELASGLDPSTGYYTHLYARDRVAGTTKMVDVAPDGSVSLFDDEGMTFSNWDVSDDGRYVVMEVRSPNFDPAAAGSQIWRRDLLTDTTTKVSVAPGGAQANGPSATPAVSGDGRYVVFESSASNLIAGSPGPGLFVHDMVTGATVRIATEGHNPDISSDGSTVVFWGKRSPSTPYEIMVGDVATATTTPLLATVPNSESFEPNVSGDGSVVSFMSYADNIVSGDVNNTYDWFVADRGAGTVEFANVTGDGSQGTGGFKASIADDGRHLGLLSQDVLTPGATEGAGNLYVLDLATHTYSLENVTASGSAAPGSGIDAIYHFVSGDGRFVTWASYLPGYVPGDDAPFGYDVFVHDGATPPESAVGTGSATTDTEGDGATVTDPIETTVTAPSGTVTIDELDPRHSLAAPIAGYTVLGQQISIHADPAPDGQWIEFVFRLDASIVPADVVLSDLRLFRNGVALDECADGSDPGPCVRSVQRLADGDLQLTANSPQASVWAAAIPGGAPQDTVDPTITIASPADDSLVTKGSPLVASFSCADDGGSGLSTCQGDAVNGAAIDTSVVGPRVFEVQASDGAGNTSSAISHYRVVYAFGGFESPIDARPTVNKVKAGSAVPVKFSLGGNQGLSIFEAGSPRSGSMTCDSGATVDAIEQTVNAGSSSLSYDAGTGQYTYVWKTDKAWGGSCRQLVMTFADGMSYRADFRFVK